MFCFTLGEDVAFWVSTGKSQLSTTRVNFNNEQIDIGDHVSLSSDIFTSPATRRYFLALSAADEARQPLEMSSVSTNPIINLKIESTNNRFTTYHSREGIVSVDEDAQVSVLLSEGRLYSGNIGGRNDLTSWVMFDLDDAMLRPEYFYIGRTSPSDVRGGILLFDTTYTGSRLLDASRYTCNKNGPMYFMLSIGVDVDDQVRVEITHDFIAGGREQYQLSSEDRMRNGQDLISRSILINCATDDEVHVYVYTGDGVYSDSAIRTSFGGFSYDPRHGDPVAWAAYRMFDWRSSATTGYSRISFLPESVNGGLETILAVDQPAGSFRNSIFTAPVTGIYLVHFSVGLRASSTVDVALYRGNDKIASLYYLDSDHDGNGLVSRTVLVEVFTGQTLDLRGAVETVVISDGNGKHTAFMGMLLYKT